MKNLILLAFCAITLLACQKELSLEPGGNTPINPLPPPPPGSSTNCLSCEYLPVCDGTKYVFQDSSAGVTRLDSTVLDFLADTTITNVPFKKIKDIPTNQNFYYSCTNNVFQVFSYQLTGTGGTTLSNLRLTLFKSNEPVGTRWKDEVNNAGTITEFRYVLAGKNLTRQVLGTTYTNVIQVIDTAVTIVPLIGEIPGAIRTIYYARAVGVIESNIIDVFTGSMILNRKLKSYRL